MCVDCCLSFIVCWKRFADATIPATADTSNSGSAQRSGRSGEFYHFIVSGGLNMGDRDSLPIFHRFYLSVVCCMIRVR